MRHSVYSHCAGKDKVPPALQNEIADAIGSVEVKICKGSSARIRDAISAKLMERGWSKPVSVAQESEMTITSTKSTVGLCLQTGNMARMYADLLKLQKLYTDNAISAAAMIVPSQPMARVMGSNVAHATRLERELDIFKRVIHVPIILFSLE